jgi:hypothetical protein
LKAPPRVALKMQRKYVTLLREIRLVLLRQKIWRVEPR